MAKSRISRTISVISNFVFLVVGVAMFSIGVYMLSSTETFVQDFQVSEALPLTPIGTAATVLGIALIFIAGAGIYGAVRKSKFILSIYLPVVLILVVAQVIVVIILFVFMDKIGKLADEGLDKFWNNNNNRDKVINIQTDLKCCGYDVFNSPQFDPLCPAKIAPSTDLCRQKLIDLLQSKVRGIAIGAFIVVFMEIVALASSCYVREHAKKEFKDNWLH